MLKLGVNGCALYNHSGETRVPEFSVPVVDTSGAGDCFAGGFLAALQRACSLEEAARSRMRWALSACRRSAESPGFADLKRPCSGWLHITLSSSWRAYARHFSIFSCSTFNCASWSRLSSVGRGCLL